jgi:hypothetical protein
MTVARIENEIPLCQNGRPTNTLVGFNGLYSAAFPFFNNDKMKFSSNVLTPLFAEVSRIERLSFQNTFDIIYSITQEHFLPPSPIYHLSRSPSIFDRGYLFREDISQVTNQIESLESEPPLSRRTLF